MANWFHRWWNPHCPHCSELAYESPSCPSCEVLKQELARAHMENEKLLNKILNPPKEEDRKVAPAPQAVLPKTIPWRVRQQMLEAEDREKAKLIANAPKPISVEDMEAAMDVAGKEREAQK